MLDVSANAEVWNQPVHSFQITNSFEISASDAAQTVSDGQLSTYIFNPKATKFMYYEMDMLYVSEGVDFVPIAGQDRIEEFLKSKSYQYILELDDSGRIIGGEWVSGSKTDHPDFVWLPLSLPAGNTTVAGITYNVVKQLINQSVQC